MLTRTIGAVSGVVGAVASITNHMHVASAAILVMCGCYAVRRWRTLA